MCKRCKERAAKLNQGALTVIEMHRAELMEIFSMANQECANAMGQKAHDDLDDPVECATNDLRFAAVLVGEFAGQPVIVRYAPSSIGQPKNREAFNALTNRALAKLGWKKDHRYPV